MKNVVTIGGGTGTFVVLSALRTLPDMCLSAIVTAADDGGSTGKLRDAYGILPPGDARQALVALAEEGSVLRDLFAYRFSKGDVAGHSLGNLFLTALSDLLGGDAAALAEASRTLRVCGTVIPATDTPATLQATLADGRVVVGSGHRLVRAVSPKGEFRWRFKVGDKNHHRFWGQLIRWATAEQLDEMAVAAGFIDAAACAHLPRHLVETPAIVSVSVPQDGWSELGELAVGSLDVG